MWYVYMIECQDGSLYTGVTTNMARRFQEHLSGRRGARYLRGRRLLGVVYLEKGHDRGSALRREQMLKRLEKKAKVNLKQSVIEIM